MRRKGGRDTEISIDFACVWAYVTRVSSINNVVSLVARVESGGPSVNAQIRHESNEINLKTLFILNKSQYNNICARAKDSAGETDVTVKYSLP